MKKRTTADYKEKTVFACQCAGCTDAASEHPAFAHSFACPACGEKLDGDPEDIERGMVLTCSDCDSEFEVVSEAPLILAKL